MTTMDFVSSLLRLLLIFYNVKYLTFMDGCIYVM